MGCVGVHCSRDQPTALTDHAPAATVGTEVGRDTEVSQATAAHPQHTHKTHTHTHTNTHTQTHIHAYAPALVGDENVGGFDVAVDFLVRVQVVKALERLPHHAPVVGEIGVGVRVFTGY